ncbi:hypothetical protein BU23DRAFT_573456 [Bimuria novae-zelandiae CBS 107.79]|uniref:Uncharacterized protein n=1 Tax=Bimuria novae-zelandiae CBS 107.79 TaxID=1447943 RepID=A0A6A5UQU7_9PLEO|nr:hypothetical protein BU23DRAFT_573456 [Bimuria novae-zelandiae CBS 107.79]
MCDVLPRSSSLYTTQPSGKCDEDGVPDSSRRRRFAGRHAHVRCSIKADGGAQDKRQVFPASGIVGALTVAKRRKSKLVLAISTGLALPARLAKHVAASLSVSVYQQIAIHGCVSCATELARGLRGCVLHWRSTDTSYQAATQLRGGNKRWHASSLIVATERTPWGEARGYWQLSCIAPW